MNIMYDEKLLGTVAFSNGCLCSKELVQREHRHFHPSGNLLPSKMDTMITDRMNAVCSMVGIQLIDHVIVGGDNREFFSFKEKGMMDNPSITYSTDYKNFSFTNSLVAERGKGR